MPVELHYNISGEGPPVMILHGLFGSSGNWKSVAKILAEKNRIIIPDLRNHGRSEHAETMTYTEMAEDVLNLINMLSLENISLIGHSMGGKIAMVSALLNPASITRLAVLDIAPVSYEHRYGKLFQAMQDLPLNQINNRNEAEKLLNDRINDTFLTRFLLQNLERNGKSFEWRLNLPAIRENVESISNFPAIEPAIQYYKPALFLGGKDSHFVQPVYHGQIQNYFPNAEIELIENAGHMLHIEQPQIVVDRLRLFLQS